MRTSKLKDEKLTEEEIFIASQGCCPDCVGRLIEGPCGGGSINFNCSLCASRFCYALDWSRLNNRLDEDQLFTRDMFSEIFCSKLRYYSKEEMGDFVAILLSLEKEVDKDNKEEWSEVKKTIKEFIFPEIIGPLLTRKPRNVR